MSIFGHLSKVIVPNHWRIIIWRPWSPRHRHSWLPGLMDWYCSLLLTAINNFRSRLSLSHVSSTLPSTPPLETANSSLYCPIRKLSVFEVMFMVHRQQLTQHVLRYRWCWREQWNTSYVITELSAKTSFGYREPTEKMKLLIVPSCLEDPSQAVVNPTRFCNQLLMLILFIFLFI